MAITQKTNHTPPANPESDDERRLREAIAELDRGEGIVVSEEEEGAIRREIEDLERRNVQGGMSPTLERLMQKHQQRRAAARA